MSRVSFTAIPTNTPVPSLHPSCRAGPAGYTQEEAARSYLVSVGGEDDRLFPLMTQTFMKIILPAGH